MARTEYSKPEATSLAWVAVAKTAISGLTIGLWMEFMAWLGLLSSQDVPGWALVVDSWLRLPPDLPWIGLGVGLAALVGVAAQLCTLFMLSQRSPDWEVVRVANVLPIDLGAWLCIDIILLVPYSLIGGFLNWASEPGLLDSSVGARWLGWGCIGLLLLVRFLTPIVVGYLQSYPATIRRPSSPWPGPLPALSGIASAGLLVAFAYPAILPLLQYNWLKGPLWALTILGFIVVTIGAVTAGKSIAANGLWELTATVLRSGAAVFELRFITFGMVGFVASIFLMYLGILAVGQFTDWAQVEFGHLVNTVVLGVASLGATVILGVGLGEFAAAHMGGRQVLAAATRLGLAGLVIGVLAIANLIAGMDPSAATGRDDQVAGTATDEPNDTAEGDGLDPADPVLVEESNDQAPPSETSGSQRAEDPAVGRQPVTTPERQTVRDAPMLASTPAASDEQAPELRVTAGTKYVLGALPKEQVDDVVRGRTGAVSGCFRRALGSSGPHQGELVVKFVITKDGGVSSVPIVSNTTGNDGVAKCAQDAIDDLRFPKPPGAGIVIVTYAFQISPE